MPAALPSGRRRLAVAGSWIAAIWLGFAAAPFAAAAEKDASDATALESITAADLKLHVDRLADDRFEGREAGRRGGRSAGDYLQERLRDLEIPGGADEGKYFQHFAPNFRNVLAVVRGSDPQLRDQYLVISAHYDHVGYGTRRNSRGPIGYIHNGADDNASGTSGLLELAEALTLLPEAPKRSVLLVFWDAEEKGLLGSKHWVAHPTVPLGSVRMIVNMDMIGRLRHDRLKVFGTRTGFGLRRLVSEANGQSDLCLAFDWDLKPKADHYPFVERDIPALLLHTGLHDEYHSPRDDPGLINHAGMQRVVRLLFQAVCALADGPEVTPFRAAAHHESEYRRRRLATPPPPLPGRLGVAWSWDEPADEGLRLTQVHAGSAAAQADLRADDRIVRFAGHEIHGGEDLIGAVAGATSPAVAVVRRPGEEEPLEISVELGGKPLRLGITWRIDEAAPGSVILTRVVPGSPAARAGLRVGDRVYRIGGGDFADGNELATRAKTLPEPLELLVERAGRLETVRIYIDTEPPKRAA